MNFYILFKRLSLIFVILCCSLLVNAQEQLRPLSSNINIPPIPAKNHLSSKTSSVTLLDTIPFFDDFSYAQRTNYPTRNHWMDSSVYVNMDFGIAPPSLGVATFDGLNKLGYPYVLNSAASVSGSSDVLTSRPINLQKKGNKTYTIADSLYLSFHFQAQGRGDWPEPNDSLCVDFKKSNQNKWVKVWGRKGYNPTPSDTSFYIAMIAIKDTAYLDSTFQFRFRNKSAQSGSVDHWHIDYVYLNDVRNRNDTTINDITFAYKSTPFLKNYFKMPYRQYIPLEMATSFKNYFRSNYMVDQSPNYKYNVYDNSNILIASEALGNFNNPGIRPFKNNGYFTGMPQSNPSLTITPFPSSLTAETNFKIEHILVNGSGDAVPQNDTLVQTQTFSNYYAYDDGTAEVGYYINDYLSKTAVRFTLNKTDTLRAVRIYFDPIIDGHIIKTEKFRLYVWANSSGTPGGVILKDSLINPTYHQLGYNFIPTYTLTSCLPLNAGTYFIGFQQQTSQGLNVGFDRNTNHMDALYYDRGFGWTQSSTPGSIMVNPVFLGCTENFVGIKENKVDLNALSIYPNPAQNSLTIKCPVLNDATVSILSALGQTVYTDEFQNEQAIDISNIPNGIYFVYINSKEQNVSPKKLIISR